MMTAVEESPLDFETMKSIPGIAVYIAEKEEPLWKVGKDYGASMEEIKKMNQLEQDYLKEGQKVLIVKKVRELL